MAKPVEELDEPMGVIWVEGTSFHIHTTDHATFVFDTLDAAAQFLDTELR